MCRLNGHGLGASTGPSLMHPPDPRNEIYRRSNPARATDRMLKISTVDYLSVSFIARQKVGRDPANGGVRAIATQVRTPDSSGRRRWPLHAIVPAPRRNESRAVRPPGLAIPRVRLETVERGPTSSSRFDPCPSFCCIDCRSLVVSVVTVAPVTPQPEPSGHPGQPPTASPAIGSPEWAPAVRIRGWATG